MRPPIKTSDKINLSGLFQQSLPVSGLSQFHTKTPRICEPIMEMYRLFCYGLLFRHIQWKGVALQSEA